MDTINGHSQESKFSQLLANNYTQQGVVSPGYMHGLMSREAKHGEEISSELDHFIITPYLGADGNIIPGQVRFLKGEPQDFGEAVEQIDIQDLMERFIDAQDKGFSIAAVPSRREGEDEKRDRIVYTLYTELNPVTTSLSTEKIDTSTILTTEEIANIMQKMAVFCPIGDASVYKEKLTEIFAYLKKHFESILDNMSDNPHTLESFLAEYEDKIINYYPEDISETGGILLLPFMGEATVGKRIEISTGITHSIGCVDQEMNHVSQNMAETIRFIQAKISHALTEQRN